MSSVRGRHLPVVPWAYRAARVLRWLFAAAVAVTLVTIAAQAQPFSGEFGVKPDVLLRVVPRGRP